jgi:hypothetical protein
MKKYISLLFASLFLFALMSFVSRSQNDPWPVPDKYKNMPNPVKSDAASIANGKALLVNTANHVMVQREKVMDLKRHNSILNAGILQNLQPNRKLMGPYFIKHLKGVKTCHRSRRKLLIKMIFGLL